MRVLLRADVENLGQKGDVLDVADGYARNYLMPRGFAIKATKGSVRQADAMRRNRDARTARERADAEALVGRLTGVRIEVRARSGEGGRLFGSVTAADIVDAVATQTGVELDRRRTRLNEPVKALGPVEVPVRLHPDLDEITLDIEVIADS